MIYKSFQVQVIIRITGLFISSVFFAEFIRNEERLMAAIFFAISAVLLTISLILYCQGRFKSFADILETIESEISQDMLLNNNFPDSFKRVHNSIEGLRKNLSKNRIELQQNIKTTEHILNNLPVGLMVAEDDGNLVFFNPTMQRMLRMKKISNTNELDIDFPELSTRLKLLFPNTQLVRELTISGKVERFIIIASEIWLDGKPLKIFSFQNIRTAFEKGETESFHKLLKILVHELSNSVTAIKNLISANSRSLENVTNQVKRSGSTLEGIEDLSTNNQLLARHSEDLLKFSNQFKEITALPKPRLENIAIEDLFTSIQQMMSEQVKQEKITLDTNTGSGENTIFADRGMVIQIILNLVKNSIESLRDSEHKKVELIYEDEGQYHSIRVTDSGPGIPEDVIDNIFVPFFTTKQSGSGIGLSISRYIMLLHRGEISVDTGEPGNTTFVLRFRK